jgi:hypothetical protein
VAIRIEQDKCQETQLLVAIRIEQDKLFKLNRTHRSLWDGISKKKMAEKGIKYTGAQGANKWKSLKRDYTAVIDHNAKSGNEPKKCKFYTELNQLYGNKPSTKPGFCLDSMGYKKSHSTTTSTSDSSSSASIPSTGTSGQPVSSSTSSSPSTYPSSQTSSVMYRDLSPDSDQDKSEPKRKKCSPGRKTKSKRAKSSTKTGVDKILDYMVQTQKNEEERQRKDEEFLDKQNKEKLKCFDKLLDALLNK